MNRLKLSSNMKEIPIINIEFISKNRLQYGNNPMLFFKLNGKEMSAFRQGGLGIWAFQDRLKFSEAQRIEIDRQLNDIWEYAE